MLERFSIRYKSAMLVLLLVVATRMLLGLIP